MNKAPKVNIEKQSIVNNWYNRNGDRWDIPTLIQDCKEKGYKPFDVPLAAIDLTQGPHGLITDWYDFIYEMKRVQDCDLKYPILLDDTGFVCDGWHRIAKAVLQGKTTIQAIRIEKMPRPSGKSEEN